MPTLPREQPQQPVQAHQARAMAESFGVDAERYDRARPRYPEALIERIAGAGLEILDVGCGTGIEARQLQAAGCTVLGVDPDARMAAFARDSGVPVEVATFETWNPADRTFDAVVAGQAWHWVDPVAGAAKAARVLRPGGRLTVFGHVFDAPPPVNDAFTEAYLRVAPDSPVSRRLADGPARTPLEIYEEMYATIAGGIRQADGLGEPEHWRFEWEQSYTREEWLDHLPTTGGLTRLPADALAEVLEHVGAAIDRIGGGFTLPYVTLAVTATRTP